MGITTRKTPRSLSYREFWFDSRDRKKILNAVQPKFLAAMRRLGLLIQNQVGETIIKHPAVRFALHPQFSYRRTKGELPEIRGRGKTDGKPHRLKRAFPDLIKGKRISRFDLIRIKLPAPKDRKEARRFLDRAEKHLVSLGFDKRFRFSYRKNAELWIDRYFNEMTIRIEGELLDQLVSILGGVRGERLWNMLVTDEDEMVLGDLESRLATCNVARGSLSISHNAAGLIIKDFFRERKLPTEGLNERLRTRRRRKN